MKILLIFSFICFSCVCQSQVLINLVLVGDNGITEDIKQAKYIVAVKTYGDTLFERLEYKVDGPMMKRISYKDSLLQIKHGPYAEYFASGLISSEGNYTDNKKDGNWYSYINDTKPTFEYKYENGNLITTINLDSLRAAEKDKKPRPGEIEAEYKGGQSVYAKEITKRMREALEQNRFKRSGNVRIKFVVNKLGKMERFSLTQSTEFLFDEECLTVMRSIPNNWTPAMQDGKAVNAYREQPLTFTIQEQ